MTKIFRALLISAVATAAAAVVLKRLAPDAWVRPRPAAQPPGPYVDADRLTEEEQALLMQELEEQI